MLHTKGMDAVGDIKNKLAVEDVVADYLELKKSGRNFKALSPFTQEKTASFMVSPDKQIWHDFSSNKGGDMFTFIQEVEGVDFKEALEILARKAGVDLSQYQRSGGMSRDWRKELENALQLAARWYQVQMLHNPAALRYVTQKRHFNRQVIQDFLIGYAPAKVHALSDYLISKNVTKKAILQSGLAVERRGQLVDMFRGRVLVALSDRQGNPIGFTGRQLIEGDGPKYINTAQTPLYDKSRHVFGLHLAKQAIRDADLAVMAEGNLDVVSAHQAGFANVVATAGTALTAEQIKQLKNLSTNIALAFDGDRAGIAATMRAVPIAQTLGVNLYVIDLPNNQDPDDIIKASPRTWEKLVEGKIYALDWVRGYFKNQHNLTEVEGKKWYVDDMLQVLKSIQSEVEQEHYMGVIASDVGSTTNAIKSQFERIKAARPRRKKAIKKQDFTPSPRGEVVARDLLALALMYPHARSVLQQLEPHHWPGDTQSETFLLLVENNATMDELFKSDLKKVENFVKILQLIAEERYQDWPKADVLVEADRLALVLQQLETKKNKATLTEEIRQAELAGDWETVQKLINQHKDQA